MIKIRDFLIHGMIAGHVLVIERKPRIQFNAHRVYSFEQIKEYFEGFDIADFSLISDDRSFAGNAQPAMVTLQYYGCGCFHFIKKMR